MITCARVRVEPHGQTAAEQGREAEDDARRQQEEQAEQDDLHDHASPFRGTELRQKGKEKKRDLGVGDVHKHAAPVERRVADEGILFPLRQHGPCAQGQPGQIEQVGGPRRLEQQEGGGRMLEDGGHSHGHQCGMEEKSAHKAKGGDQPGAYAVEG